MQFVGKDVYIQRGENWSLDFDVVNAKGDPMMLLKNWENPYLAITVTAARYEQEGDFRVTYWLNLKDRLVEQPDGSLAAESIKTFISTEALFLPEFSIDEALALYGTDAGGKVTLSDGDFNITNFLFFTDPDNDGNRVYKYVKHYATDGDGKITIEEWEEYNFRVIKQFDTREWTEQKYLYDAKILAGTSLQEYISNQLSIEGITVDTQGDWGTQLTQQYIDTIKDMSVREYAQKIFDEGMPLIPSYDTKTLIIEPSNIYVSADIQGGIIK